MAQTETSDNQVTDSETHTIVQAGSVDQLTDNSTDTNVVIHGDGATVVHGDHHGPISHTFGR